MITYIRIHNFKTLLNFELHPTHRHLLIGKNNSGKTNLLEALRFLGATAVSEFANIPVPGGTDTLCNWSYDSRAMEFEYRHETELKGETLRFKYRLTLDVQGSLPSAASSEPFAVKHELLTITAPGWPNVTLMESDGHSVELLHEERYLENGAGTKDLHFETQAPRTSTMLFKLYELPTNKRSTLFKRALASSSYNSLSPPLMRWAWQHKDLAGDSAYPLLSIHGENLPLALFKLKNEDEPRYRQLLNLVTGIEPSLDSFGFLTLPDNRPFPYVHLSNKRKVSWQTLSDGTLCFLGLLTIMTQAAQMENIPGWPAPSKLIEEPNNYLFRGLVRDVWGTLDSIAPVSQIIFTTHDPYFIDLFEHKLGSVTVLKKDGDVTTAHPLNLHRDTIDEYRNRYDMTLGELHFREMLDDRKHPAHQPGS